MISKARVRHTEHFTCFDDAMDDIPPKDGYVDLAYCIIGDGPEKVVMIAGMCVSHEMWKHQVASFRTTNAYTLLLLDNRGAGESSAITAATDDDSLNGYTMNAMARDVWAVVDVAFGRRSHVHLVGHSMGSMIAQRAALITTQAHRVASTALLCGHDGGWFWNNAPSAPVLRALLEVTASRFDPVASAEACLRLHFTREFLDGWTICSDTGRKARRRDVMKRRYVDGLPINSDDTITLPHVEVPDSQHQVQHHQGFQHSHHVTPHPQQLQSQKQQQSQQTDQLSTNQSPCHDKQVCKYQTKRRASFWQHLAAARTHYLSPSDAAAFRERPYPKIVIYGRQDAVVLPRASRQLAGRTGARVVSVDAAHFAMEEAAAEINRLLILHINQASVLRNAALANRNDVCSRLLKPEACLPKSAVSEESI